MIMRKTLLVLLFVCLGTSVFADMTVVEKVHTGAMMGQPAKDSAMTMRIKGKKARVDDTGAGTSIIVDLAAGKLYRIESSKKEVMVMSLDMAAQASNMLGQMTQNQKSTLEKGAASKEINGYKCDEYHISTTGGMINLDATYWVTKDVDSSEYAPFREYSMGVMKMMNMEDLAKLDGIPIRSQTKMNMMGQNIDVTNEVQSISKDPIADSIFAIPADYKVQEMKMPQMPTPPQQ